MKTKILNALGYIEKKKSWSDIDTNIQLRIYKDIALAIIILVFGVYLFVLSPNWKVLVATILGAGVLLLLTYNKVLIFEYETHVSMIGECIKIDRPQKIRKIYKSISYGKCTAVIKVDDFFVEIIIPHTTNITEGTKIAIYAMPNAIMQRGDDYYLINNYLAIKTLTSFKV